MFISYISTNINNNAVSGARHSPCTMQTIVAPSGWFGQGPFAEHPKPRP